MFEDHFEILFKKEESEDTKILKWGYVKKTEVKKN